METNNFLITNSPFQGSFFEWVQYNTYTLFWKPSKPLIVHQLETGLLFRFRHSFGGKEYNLNPDPSGWGVKTNVCNEFNKVN
jgi:hypothetical protein